MLIQIRGFYYSSDQNNAFIMYAVNSDESFINRVEMTESETWEAISYFLEHPHYMVTHYGFDGYGEGSVQERVLRFDCVYAPTLKAMQIAEFNKWSTGQ